ncbi:MAG: ATP-dependent DNA ligase [Acidimicrobiia bacterium]|nr:ATP-dependent DNA ligase [Acidimicrobiia bacterium]
MPAKKASKATRGKPAKKGDGEALGAYRAKRDFGVTPEPSPEVPPAASDRLRFVVQEHHARAMHWDFRLERDGVLVSWAVPKGLPPDPSVNHLAVQTEDHPMSYVDFAGEIPKGEYGGGTVQIWDAGWYELQKWEPKEVVVTLHGERVEGRYALIRTRDKQWLMHRMDPPQDPEREPFPSGLRPMLPKRGALPDDDADFGFEIARGGRRVLIYGEGGRVEVDDADGTNISDRYPELSRLGRELGSREVVIDGELVGLDANEQPVAGRPPDRSDIESDSALRRAAREHPVAVMLFDILYCEGRATIGLPYTQRRERLESLGLAGPNWQTPAFHVGDGGALLTAARGRGLPGVVAKRLESVYQVGKQSADWILVDSA